MRSYVYPIYRVSLVTVIVTAVAPCILAITIPQIDLLTLMVLFLLEVWIYGLIITVFSESRMQEITVSKIIDGVFHAIPIDKAHCPLEKHFNGLEQVYSILTHLLTL